MSQRFHLIGIGGAGMSVVAHLLVARGQAVSGSDAKDGPALAALRQAGATVHVGHDPQHLPAGATVVVSTAVRETNPELARARADGHTVIHRSQALALAGEGLDFVAIAGAHGKTTTTAMAAMALRAAGTDPSFAIGSTVQGLGLGAHLGSGNAIIVEADESDGSFLNYTPTIAVVTNIEADHLDHWGSEDRFEQSFRDFAGRISPGGLLISCADDDGARHLATWAVSHGIRTQTYGTTDAVAGAESHVKITGPGAETGAGPATVTMVGDRKDNVSAQITLTLGGYHHVRNAGAAWAVGLALGADPDQLARGLSAFTGTGRRFEQRGTAGGVRVVDDYAHHPTEVAATLQTARHLAGEGRVGVIFQPHLFTRTRTFAADFARALEAADFVVVCDIFASREDPLPGVDTILITRHLPGATYIGDRFEAGRVAANQARPGDLLLTMGAGDITDVAATILAELDTAPGTGGPGATAGGDRP